MACKNRNSQQFFWPKVIFFCGVLLAVQGQANWKFESDNPHPLVCWCLHQNFKRFVMLSFSLRKQNQHPHSGVVFIHISACSSIVITSSKMSCIDYSFTNLGNYGNKWISYLPCKEILSGSLAYSLVIPLFIIAFS